MWISALSQSVIHAIQPTPKSAIRSIQPPFTRLAPASLQSVTPCPPMAPLPQRRLAHKRSKKILVYLFGRLIKSIYFAPVFNANQ